MTFKRENVKDNSPTAALSAFAFFVVPAMLPLLLSSYFNFTGQDLVFPVQRLETALWVFPNLNEIVPRLSQLKSSTAAARYALLYANLFFFDVAVVFPIALCVLLKTHRNFILAKSSELRDPRAWPLGSKRWRTIAFLVSIFLGCIYLQFFSVSVHSPPRWMSTEKVISNQYSAIWTNLALLNLSSIPVLRVLVWIFWK